MPVPEGKGIRRIPSDIATSFDAGGPPGHAFSVIQKKTVTTAIRPTRMLPTTLSFPCPAMVPRSADIRCWLRNTAHRILYHFDEAGVPAVPRTELSIANRYTIIIKNRT
jgi:hypothetical protein